MLDFLRSGDTLVVTLVDRLARSIRDQQDTSSTNCASAGSHSKQPSSRSTPTAFGKAFLDMLVVFTDFETNMRRERQLEGIAAAKA